MTVIRKTMRAARRKRATLKSIGQQFGVTTGTVQRILDGAYPDEANAKRLGVPVKCTTCKRNMPKPRKPRQAKRIDQYFLDWMMTG